MSILARLPGASLLRWGLRRRALLARAALRGRELRPVHDRTRAIAPGDLLLCCTLRDEAVRLPFFLDYYRRLGIGRPARLERQYSASRRTSGSWITWNPRPSEQL